jgi:hypothetical protein
MIRYILMGFLVVVTGCASSGIKGGTQGTDGVNLKSQEYEALKKDVTEFHTGSLIGSDKPWLFNHQTVENLPKEFARKNCPSAGNFRTNDEANTCAHLFNRAAFNMLSEAYFAADTNEIGKKCANDMLVCTDLMAIESLFRSLHNASIQESEREKLASLDEWKAGKLSDDELKSLLHLEFGMKDGKFIVSLPSNAEASAVQSQPQAMSKQ